MRTIRSAALGATLLALIVGACTSGGGSSPSPAASVAPSAASSPSAPASPNPPLASTLILGGPPECPQRPYCALGLKDTYGIEFKEFKPLDAGGPLTVAAVKDGQVDVGLLFTSDPAIAVNGFVLLEDDKKLQLADNIIPIVRQEVLDADTAGVMPRVLNDIMAKLTQEELTKLNQAVTVDGQTAADAAKAWLEANGFLGTVDSMARGEVTVGSTNFYEQEILGELFAQALAHNGWTVEKKFQLGNREIVFPALRSGEIDILAEYAASALAVAYKGWGTATSDIAETAGLLKTAAAAENLAVLDYAPATDQNGFVVTKETADKYGLAKLSDLAKPAP